jgi:hypothetical protein
MKSERATFAQDGKSIDQTRDDKIGSLFQPDTVLSAQYFDTLRRKTLLEPEKRLMLAVLEDAINCFQDNLFSQKRKNQRLFADAEEWFATTGGDSVFSFDNVCEALGFSPEYLRQGLVRWKAKNWEKGDRKGILLEKKLAS